MKKTHKVVMLPTEKASNIIFEDDDVKRLHIAPKERQHEKWNYQHLYIISEDEIKEGDWYLVGTFISQCGKENLSHIKTGFNKIVATTDKYLGVKSFEGTIYSGKIFPQLTESFIQAYIKAYNEGKPITEVDLEIEDRQAIVGGTDSDIKTRPDNTVIIHQSKLYTRDEVEGLLVTAHTDFMIAALNNKPFKIRDWTKDNL